MENGARDISFEVRAGDGKTIRRINRQVEVNTVFRFFLTADFDVLTPGFYNLFVVNPRALVISSFFLRAVVTRIV